MWSLYWNDSNAVIRMCLGVPSKKSLTYKLRTDILAWYDHYVQILSLSSNFILFNKLGPCTRRKKKCKSDLLLRKLPEKTIFFCGLHVLKNDGFGDKRSCWVFHVEMGDMKLESGHKTSGCFAVSCFCDHSC